MSSLWHGFGQMGAIKSAPFVIVRGEGARIWDRDGKEYLDASAGLWFCSVGHGRREIAEAAAAQMTTLATHHNFFDHANEPAMELAERICGLSPHPDGAVFFTCGGSEAIDSACKLARRYWAVMGQPKKTTIISREHGYHGMNAYGTSIGGIPANGEGYGGTTTLIPDTVRVRYDDPEDLEETLDRYYDRTAAFIGEPVMGAGGVLPPPDGYWQEIQRICRERDILFIQDEVICGFGRLGTWFGAQRYGVEPDLMTFAKGVTSGYLPLGGIIASPRVKEPFFAEGGPMFRHGFTYTAHATCCAAGMANLDIIEREDLVGRVRELEPLLAELMEPLRELDVVSDVRTVGLLGGVEFSAEAREAKAGLADAICMAVRRAGVVTRPLRGVALQLSPPYVTTESELAAMVEGVAAGIREVAAVTV
jgi:adenosylmethionine-8-amino-7-oxononanoate aminotransferase